MALRTNPAYAHLAYRKTIVAALKVNLRERYMALSSTEPDKTLLCEDVFHQDSNVPVEEVQLVVEELEQEEERLRIQMTQFSFSKQEENDGLLNSKKNEEQRENRPQKGAKKSKSPKRRS